MLYDPVNFTCTCPSTHYNSKGACIRTIYIYIYIYIYIVCDISCEECENSSTNCILCNTLESYHPLDNQPSTCNFLCKSEDALYLNTSTFTCKTCHENCLSCIGHSSTLCTKCLPPYQLGNNTECLYSDCSNYPNTFSSDYICQSCDSKCDGCLGTSNNCLSCHTPYLFWGVSNSCLLICPLRFYSYVDMHICQGIYIYIYIYIGCPDNCLTCERINFSNPSDLSPHNFNCTSCTSPNYFLSSKNICVTDTECGLNFYPERSTMTCNMCHTTCVGCNGPNIYECKACADERTMNLLGICVDIKCPNDQEYFDLKLFNCQSIFVYIVYSVYSVYYIYIYIYVYIYIYNI